MVEVVIPNLSSWAVVFFSEHCLNDISRKFSHLLSANMDSLASDTSSMSRQVEVLTGSGTETEAPELPQGDEDTKVPIARSTGLEPKARVVLTYTGLSRCPCVDFSSYTMALAVAGCLRVCDCNIHLNLPADC